MKRRRIRRPKSFWKMWDRKQEWLNGRTFAEYDIMVLLNDSNGDVFYHSLLCSLGQRRIPGLSNEIKLERQKQNIAARGEVGDVLLHRIFIAKEIEDRKIYSLWSKAIEEYASNGDAQQFGKQFREIVLQVREGAKEDMRQV